MNLINSYEGLWLLILFGILMIGLVYWLGRSHPVTRSSFLIANRKISWLPGALSIAVSWLWAPAIFIVSLQAYTKGIAGAFWFIVPNILCFFIFAPLAMRLRKLIPYGYTLPEYILNRFKNDKKTHIAFLIIFFGYQLGAIIINTLAGGLLLNILTGIPFAIAAISLSFIALLYSTIRGLEASVMTDVIQMLLILTTTFILVPWAFIEIGGFAVIKEGLGGITGDYDTILNAEIAYSFGIAMTLSLLSGPFGDQMFFQRAFAVRPKDITKTFVFGGLFFGLIPITLSVLGFIGAGLNLQVSDPQMIGPLVIGELLPHSALLIFLFMAFAGLASTLDSAYCAISSLGSIDIYKNYFNNKASDKSLLKFSRLTMLIMSLIGTGIALLKPKLLWIFLIYGALASAAFFPTILSVFWDRLTKKGAFWSIIISIGIGLPLSIYANIKEDTDLIVLSAVVSFFIGLIICLFDGLSNKADRFDFQSSIDEQKTALN